MVSDYWAVPFLASMHRVAPGHAEAGALALEAGIDVELPDTLGYGDGLVELVRSGAARRVARRPGRPAGAARQGTARPARRRVDTRGVGRERRRGRPRLAGQPGAGARGGRALGRPARRRHGAADQERAAPAAAEGGRGRALRRRPADVHGLLRVPHPRAAAPPAGRVSASRCRRPWTPCAPSWARRRWSTRPGASVHGRGPQRVRGGGGGRARRRPLRGLRRRPRGTLRPRLVRRGLRRRGPAAAGRPGRPGRGAAGDRDARGAGRRLGPPLRARASSTAALAGWCSRSSPARRAGPRSPGCSRVGCAPEAGCRCRSRAGRAGSPAPTSSRRWAGSRAPASPRSTPPPSTPSGTARPTPPSSSDEVRASAAGDRHRRGGGAERGRDEHRRPGGRRGRPGLPARPGGPGRPARAAADRLRPRPPRAGLRRPSSSSTSTPTAPPTLTRGWTGSSRQARCSSSSAPLPRTNGLGSPSSSRVPPASSATTVGWTRPCGSSTAPTH